MAKINFVRIFACAILCLILVHSFMGEKIAMNDGAGGDGLFYREVSAGFTDDILSKGYDSFRLQRIAPFALENVVYTILDIPKDNHSLMIGILLLNALSVLLLLIYFFRTSNLLKWFRSTELITFSLTFFNFHTLKNIGYEPFQTDAFALTLSFMSFYHFLKNEKWKVVILSVISSFVWPLLGLTGLIMAFFPRDKVAISSPATSDRTPLKLGKRLPYGFAFAYLLLIVAMALFNYFRYRATHFNEMIFHLPNSMPFAYFMFTAFCTAIFLFFLLRPISISVLDFIRGLSKKFTFRSAFCFFAIYLCIQAIVHIFSNNDFFYSTSNFILQICLRPLQAPFIFLENHVMYWGILPLLCIFFWKSIVREMENNGYGYLTVMAALVIFLLDSESRHSITFLPLLLLPLGTVLDTLPIKPWFAYAVAVGSLLLSRFYYTINVEGIQQAFESMDMSVYKTFPAQRYFMNLGPWQSGATYLIASAIALLTFAGVYFLLHKITQTRETKSE